MKAALFTLGSFILTFAVIGNAYYQKKEFYPTAIYITKSKFSIAGFVFVFLAAKVLVKIFFGHLRSTEFEHLRDKFWYAITETCLAFTMFKDDLSPQFIALFTILLFLRSFHWLAEERIDFIERSPIITMLFHIRIISLLFLLLCCDAAFVYHAYHSIMNKPSVQIVFGFEYAILFVIGLNITIKYILHAIDLQNETPWDDKAVCLLYSDLIMGLCKVILFLAFVSIMIKFYSFFPLFIVRPMYLSLRAFRKALLDVIMSRRAVYNMNTLYPNATTDELQSLDNVCIICREEMTAGAKKLPCNHIFHSACLRSWFQRQQTCPTCRMNVLQVTAPGVAQGTTHSTASQIQQPPPNAQMPPNMFPVPPNFWPSLQQLNYAINGTRQEAGSSHDTNNSSASTVPLIFPPFPLLPFMIPPPPPPNDLMELSINELQLMEGNDRKAIELRLKILKNVKTLLDAAMLQINQYSLLMNANLKDSETQTEFGIHSISELKENHYEDKFSSICTDDELRKRRLQKFQPES